MLRDRCMLLLLLMLLMLHRSAERRAGIERHGPGVFQNPVDFDGLLGELRGHRLGHRRLGHAGGAAERVDQRIERGQSFGLRVGAGVRG